MVTIKYYESATSKQCELSESLNIAEFLRSKHFTVNELQSLRFFKGSVVGEEIDTSDVRFLNISDGVIEVVNADSIPHGPALPFIPYIVAALTLAVALSIRPSISTELPPNSKAKSSTNSLGQSANEVNIGSRIPDVFGKVTKHTPPLTQVPYRIGVNNQECEVLLLTVGVGKYEINLDEIYDGYTPYKQINNAKVNIYEPNSYPGKGLPAQQIGGLITEQIGIYAQSNDLNPAELPPPNDVISSDLVWRLTGDATGTVGTLRAVNIPDDFDFEGNYAVGTNVTLFELYYFDPTTVVELWDPNVGTVYFDAFDKVDLGTSNSLVYIVTNVTSDTITVDIPSTASQQVKDAWIAMNNYNVEDKMYYVFEEISGSLPTVDAFYTDDDRAVTDTLYTDDTYTVQMLANEENYSRVVSGATGVNVGPFAIKQGSTEVIVNLTSESGFYKLVNNNETDIDANVEFIIEELDSNGSPTGNEVPHSVTYSSNNNVRQSVFQTYKFSVPYEHAQISARRTTLRDKADGVSNVDTIKWRDLYTFEPHSVDMDLGNITMMHCYVPSNSQSRLIKERKTNLTLTRKLTPWLTGGEMESLASDNFADILIHTALDPKNGRLTLDQINATNFMAVSDAIKAYFGNDDMVRFGYVFDDNEISYEEMFTIICDAVNCIPYVQNGVYDLFFERPQTASTMQITCRNKLPETEVREDIFFKEYDGVELTYRDELTSVQETIYVPNDRTANNPQRVELLGVTTEAQALVKANRIRNKQIYHTTNVEFATDEFGRLLVPGQRIDSPDGTRFIKRTGDTDGYVVYEGEVVEFNGLTVELSEPVTFVDDEDHYIQFTNLEGDNSELILCTAGDDEFTVVLSTTPSESLYDGYERDKTKFTFCSEQVRESIALIPQTIETKVDSGQETNTVSCINYDSRYYRNDLI